MGDSPGRGIGLGVILGAAASPSKATKVIVKHPTKPWAYPQKRQCPGYEPQSRINMLNTKICFYPDNWNEKI